LLAGSIDGLAELRGLMCLKYTHMHACMHMAHTRFPFSQGEYGSASYKGKSVGLLKPTTYMNNSGQSVRKVRSELRVGLGWVGLGYT
jgi:peptidyl-tRNA hydrolase